MIKFNDCLYNFRNKICDMFYSLLNKKDEDINYDEIFEKIELISNNEKYYRLFVTILFIIYAYVYSFNVTKKTLIKRQ